MNRPNTVFPNRLNRMVLTHAVLWLGTLSAYAQQVEPPASHTVSAQPSSPPPTTLSAAVEPQFPGGQAALTAFMQKNMQYPLAARMAKIEGRVFTEFAVDTNGVLTDVRVLKGMGFGTDAEAVRLVKAMPPWLPARQSGQAVRLLYHLPITFSLEQEQPASRSYISPSTPRPNSAKS